MDGSTLNCNQFFKILAGAQSKTGFGGFKTQLKFIKFIDNFMWDLFGFKKIHKYEKIEKLAKSINFTIY